MNNHSQPLVYACSGCSNVAQLANTIAIRLDRAGVAEMSCIAGVGGGVPALLRIARSGRRIIAIDGCKLHCALACLNQAGVSPDEHVTLSDHGVRKRFGEDCSAQQADELYAGLVKLVEKDAAQPQQAGAGSSDQSS
ncbi:zinc-binding protein [Halopseudomonas nanhaiensis]|uniref:putative zinc-binding protein n=1 Tax=Halopseudomonas nanhaiensis TaxID=2830842 RepID=UPI001CC13353|nr:putative zinc-binding protein [Halopseudomonas nanhaiensis]UAW99339.1 zinc-binding protein [Halopseudomonas nanhaiensis]